MPEIDDLSPGSLVQVDHAGQSVLALVERLDRGLVQVQTETGIQLRLKSGKIQHRLPSTVPFKSDQIRHFEEFRVSVSRARETIDLRTIWDLLVNEPEEARAVEELASLWFGDVDAVRFFAMVEALQQDSVYFKLRANGYHPRTLREVEAEQERQKGVQDRSQERERALQAVTTHLDETGDRSVETLREPGPGKYLDILLDFATYGDYWERKKEALDLIAEINQRQGRRTFGEHSKGAFELLLALGLVSEHENLSLRRHRIRTTFDEQLIEVANQLATGGGDELVGAVDLTRLETFTVDGITTRDMDDALHVEHSPDGTWQVGVHITDVGSLIEPGSPLDVEASRRGSSLYLPTGLIPMFPSSLSEGRLSLIAGEVRPTTSFLVHLDEAGRILSTRVVSGIIRVRHRWTYEEADERLLQPGAPLHAELSYLQRVARQHRIRREQQGAVFLELPEVKVRLIGGEIHLERTGSSPSRGIVAELMVLAGQVAARLCLEERIPTVYRVQDSLLENDLSQLDSIENDLVRQLEMARQMRRAELRSKPGPHMGLGLDAYVQATSPIRRYADLVVNFQIQRFLRNGQLAFGPEELVTVAAKAEQAAQECLAVQRETEHYWLLEYIRRQGQVPLEAVVLYHDPRLGRPTIPVLLRETMIRSQIPARDLAIGEEIQVRPVHVDPRRELLRLERI